MKEEELKNYLNSLLEKGLKFLKVNNSFEAKKCFENILKHKLNHPHVLNLLGITLVKLKKYNESILNFKLAIKNDKKQEGFYVNLGNAYEKLKKFDKALLVYKQGLIVKENSSILFNQMGLIYFNQNNFVKASNYFRDSLKIDPKNKFTINNIGLINFEFSNFKSAYKYFNESISLDNSFSSAHFNIGLLYLLEENFLNGWPKYEYRSFKKKYPQITQSKSEWDGSDVTNKNLLILNEQGIGDNVQFARYISLIKKNNTKIILFVKNNFKSFYEKLDCVDIIVDEIENIPHFDNYIFLMSLPNIFKKQKIFPPPLNFFFLKNENNKKWRSIFENYDKNLLKVGLVWQGDHINNRNDHKRSINLQKLVTLLKIKNINFFSLQKNFGNEQIKINKFNNLITHYDDIDKSPFEDTFCIIDNLDLIISVDTSLAHISATLGKKTWIMLAKVPDFRWGLKKTSTDWYKNVKLYRQNKINNWNFVVSNIAKDLEAFKK